LKPVVIQAAARKELRETTAWYRESNASVADRFVNEVFKTLEYIEKTPAAGRWIPFVPGSARRLPVAGFPYYVVFEELADRVEILAIAHNRRRPGYWRS
jgi:plasmid stabilization system protein ParE